MTSEEKERYSRQILFAGVGDAGQESLLRSHAAIVGCGALGSFQAAAFARAGVGRLTIIDRDYVEPSNLQRQWLFEESDAAEALPKAVAAERRLARINSSVRVQGVVADLTPANIEDLLGGAQVILDGTDNFETRYLINDFALSRGIPWIYGAAVGSYGLTMPVIPGRTACLRCVYPDPPAGAQPTCETAGVLNSITAVIAALQTADALKILAGRADSVTARITTVDVWDGGIRQIAQPAQDPDCQACGAHDFVYLEGQRRAPVSLCGRNAVQIHERARPLDLAQLRAALAPLGEVRANDFALRFLIAPYEMTIFPDGRAIIKGTTDIGLARSLYARYIGG
jgi:molybdopterin/thiamine biosynthesis adenylyltransferase